MRIKNILIYDSIWGLLDKLTDTQVSILFRSIKTWREGLEPEIEDPLIQGLWLGIEPNLVSLEESYSSKVNANRENGKKGGAPKGNRNAIKQPKTTETTQVVNKTTETTQNNPNNPNNLKEKEKEKEKERENSTADCKNRGRL